MEEEVCFFHFKVKKTCLCVNFSPTGEKLTFSGLFHLEVKKHTLGKIVFFTIFPNSLGGENVNFSLGGERVFLMCRFSPCGEHVNFSPFGENVNFSLGGERIFLMLGFSPSGDKVSFSLIGENRFTY